MKAFNQDNIAHFVLLQEIQTKRDQDGKVREGFGALSFRNYTDKVGVHGRGAGCAVEYVVSRNENGSPRGKFFTISPARNVFKVRKDEVDVTGLSMFNFLAHHPQCLGSKNGTYDPETGKQIDVVFKIMDTETDAEVALAAAELRIDAAVSVKSLDEQTLAEVAILTIGRTTGGDKQTKFLLLDWAEKFPERYFATLNSGDRPIRALIRKAVKDGIFRTQGGLHFWGDDVIGASEDQTVQYLIGQPEAVEMLKESVDLKIASTNNSNKRAPGRPRKNP